MPSAANHEWLDEESARKIVARIEEAIKRGLLFEWIEHFVGEVHGEKVHREIVALIENAIKYEMLIEWIECFVGELIGGEHPSRAAMNATVEWDL